MEFVRDAATTGKVKKTFKPLANWVVCKVREADKSKGGLLMPDGVMSPDQTPTSLVIAVGPECKWVKEGDVILANSAAPGYNIIHGDSGKLFCILESNLLGVSLIDGASAEEK